MKYYSDSSVEIYNEDCREIIPKLEINNIDLVLTDPPYGINLNTKNASRGRGLATRANDYIPVYDDDKPFDPAHLLMFKRLVLFGANHYADKLPASGCWLVWDKLDGMVSRDNADAELAWTNFLGTVRIFRHRWLGMIKASEQKEKRVHPTQKPVALMEWIIEKYTKPGDLVLDPYMGSGSVLRAAKNLNRRAIGIEIEEQYCKISADRCRQGVLVL